MVGIPSPSPEFPQQIHNVSGNNNIKIQNKNLFDKNNVIYKNKKILNDSGVEINDETGGYTQMYISVKSNVDYTISGLSSSGGKRIYFFDKNKNFISRTSSSTGTSKTFTTPNSCRYIDIQYYISGNDFNNWQLEQGSTATSYVEHQEQNLPLNLGDIELNKIDTAQDYFYKENNKWYLHKEIGIKKSGFNWNRGANYNPDVYYSTEIDDYEISNNIPLCNYFQGIENVSSESIMVGKTNQIAFRADRNYIRLYVNTSLTAEQLNALDLELYYKLYQPTNIEITDTTLINQLEAIKQAKSYNEQTNVSQTNEDLPFILDITALKK